MTLTGIGLHLRELRIAKGFSLEAMARELHWRVDLLQAVEEERWDVIPPGQERPMVRQMAERLECSLEAFPEAWATVPGEVEQEPPDPRQIKLERAMTALVALGSVLVLVWLLMPGKDLKRGAVPPPRKVAQQGAFIQPQGVTDQPFAVLGEAIPEAPVTAEGVLVILRAIDAGTARIEAGEQRLEQALRVSEPWRVRVRGPFTLILDNAGVTMVEVAGRPVRHGRHVGETWSGTFDAQGTWVLPPAPVPTGNPDTLPPENVIE